MAYSGRIPKAGITKITKQTITGTGTDTYSLDKPAGSVNDVEVFVNNVRQEPGVAYTVNGTSIIFSSNIESTDSCYIVYQGTGLITTDLGDYYTSAQTDAKIVELSPSEITKSSSNPLITTNGSIGDIWLNTTSGEMFVCTDATTNYNVWTNTGEGTGSVTPTYSAEYLVVAGGGGGQAAAGGAGGLLTSNTTLQGNNVYTITVGAGGSAYANGADSSIVGTGVSISALGGGKGYSPGGSGGGAWEPGSTGGAGTSGQGHSGGDAGGVSGDYGAGGGGGGAGAAGVSGSGSTPGVGGDGIQSSITGTATYYAGGGGGRSPDSRYAHTTDGGLGGGGQSRYSDADDGEANTGGGAGSPYTGTERAGGSGVVILSILTSKYTGTTSGSPTVTTNGDYTVLKYTSSGTYTA